MNCDIRFLRESVEGSYEVFSFVVVRDVGNPKASLLVYEYDRIRRFAKDFFGGYADYALEYLFANRV